MPDTMISVLEQPKKVFKPSAYQQRFFDWVLTGWGSALVTAVAGSGKSTSIQECLPLIPESKSVQIFVFNADIAKDWKERLAKLVERENRPFRQVRAGTFHSAGFNAVCKRLGKSTKDVETDGGKLKKIVRARLGEDDQEMYGSFVCKLVDLAKGEGIGALVPDQEWRWYDLIAHHDLSLEAEGADECRAVEIARKLLSASNKQAEEGIIDFNDQLYLVILWRLRLWQNDFVFVDEAQDTNPVRRAIAKLALRPGGRLIAVGDPKQAIYGFTGASHDALDLIKREFRCIDLPLTVSYRCPAAVVRQAQGIVPYIEAAPGAAEGWVGDMDINEGLKELTERDAILCRNTAPLIDLSFKLIARGRGCTILGKEIGEGLVNLIKSMKSRQLEGDDNSLVARLAKYAEREIAAHMAKGEESKAESISDKVACLMTVIKNLPENARTIAALVHKIEDLFSEAKGVLTLATAHKSKGKEWQRVGILRADLMPSKYARQEHQYQQELNLMYVAWTRAMDKLIFLAGEVA